MRVTGTQNPVVEHKEIVQHRRLIYSQAILVSVSYVVRQFAALVRHVSDGRDLCKPAVFRVPQGNPS